MRLLTSPCGLDAWSLCVAPRLLAPACALSLLVFMVACGSEPTPPMKDASVDGWFVDTWFIDGGFVDGAGANVDAGISGASDAGFAASSDAKDATNQPDSGLSDTAASDVGVEQDAGPQDVFTATPGLPVKAIITAVHPGPWAFAAPVAGDVSLVVNKAGDVKLVGPLDGQVDPVAGPAKQPTAVVRHGGVTYLADANGLRGILAGKLKISPLAAYLPKQPITAMQAWKTAGGVVLWLIVGDTLMRYADGQLFTITAPKMKVAGAHLSYGADVEGGPALWVAGTSGLHAIRVTDGKVTSWPYLVGRAVAGVHVDTKGRVWAASQGELLRRDAPGAWTTHVLKNGPTGLWGRPGDSAFWVRTPNALLRWDAEELHVVEGAPAVAHWRIDGAGRLTGLDAKGGLVRVQTTEPPAKPKVAWKTDIQPIFDNACAQCHGVDGVNTKLHTSAQWKSKFSKIVKNVQTGAMPLPPKQPLKSGEIALILAWQKDGFKETP